MSQTTSEPTTLAAEPSADHLAEARKYFPTDSSPSLPRSPAPQPSPASAPAPSSKFTDLEDIARGLQPPPENTKSHAGWQELKKKGNEAAARAAALAKENEELKSRLKGANSANPAASLASDHPAAAPAAPVPPERPSAAADDATRARLSELETQNQALSERLKVLDLRSHPEFVAKFVAPQNEARAALAQIARGDDIALDVDAFLALKGKAFNTRAGEVLEKLTPYARVQFQSALERYIAADLGAQEAAAHADQFLSQTQAQTGARSREAFDRTAAGYSGHFVPIVVDASAPDAEKAAAAQYNADLAAVTSRAESYAFGKLTEQSAADLAHKAALYEFTLSRGLPRIGRIFNTALTDRDAKIAALEKQVAELTAASPALDSGAGTPAATTAPADEDHLAAARKYRWNL